VLNAQFGETRSPTLERGEIWNLETDVVKAVRVSVNGSAWLVSWWCKTYPQSRFRLDENHSKAALMWIVRNSLEPEDACVPGDALLNIGDSQRQVMDTDRRGIAGSAIV
jgi:hypothetical protein